MIYFDLMIIIFNQFYNFNLINFIFLIKTMLYIPKIDDYLKILTKKEVEEFAAMNFSEYFKSIWEEQNLRKDTKSLYLFLRTSDEVDKNEKVNSSDSCIHR